MLPIVMVAIMRVLLYVYRGNLDWEKQNTHHSYYLHLRLGRELALVSAAGCAVAGHFDIARSSVEIFWPQTKLQQHQFSAVLSIATMGKKFKVRRSLLFWTVSR